MKKIKEKIKKITSKNYSFLALILAALILFGVLGGLNVSKTAKTEVNAISAPAAKNLDLNDIRYTYQTSLSELKNQYSLLDNEYVSEFIQIRHGELTEINFTGVALSDGTEGAYNYNKNILYDVVKVKDRNNNDFTFTIDEFQTGDISDEFDTNLGQLDNYIFTFNLSNLNSYDNINNSEQNRYSGGVMVNFCYLQKDYNGDDANETRNNTIIKSYVFNRGIDYTFNNPIIRDYDLRLIYISFENNTPSEQNAIYGRVPNKYNNVHSSYTRSDYITIDNVSFINNDNANIIMCDLQYGIQPNSTEAEQEPLYQGNILLSKTKYDTELFEFMSNNLGIEELTMNFNAVWGGDFGGNPLTNYVTFRRSGDIGINIQPYLYFGDYQPGSVKNNVICEYPYTTNLPTNIRYNEQFQLVNVITQDSLTLLYISGNTSRRFNALSAQVEDVLYNVDLIGNVSKVEQNEKVEEDFTNLLKTTGFGAFIGLLIGFLVGNPIGGLIVGAIIGFAVAIVPLLIDALQAIFGANFLSGLYNFFKTIAQFFVNIIDSIINFLLSIITNPFVLILILIIALLYIFVIRPKFNG